MQSPPPGWQQGQPRPHLHASASGTRLSHLFHLELELIFSLPFTQLKASMPVPLPLIYSLVDFPSMAIPRTASNSRSIEDRLLLHPVNSSQDALLTLPCQCNHLRCSLVRVTACKGDRGRMDLSLLRLRCSSRCSRCRYSNRRPRLNYRCARRTRLLDIVSLTLARANDVQPARTKRSQRAYHQDDRQGAFSPPLPQQAPSPSIPQQRTYADRPQHPYANAPPASAPPPPEEDQNPHAIAQPPHSAGQRLQGPRSRIDPNQIPSPVDVLGLDQDKYTHEPFMTCSRGAIPQSMTEFTTVDQGNCSPRFLRLTTYALPHSDDLAVASQIPLGMVVQPFAELRPEEGEVPLVDFGENGPPRCDHCRGYINPWCQFVLGGQKFVCNLCGGTSDVPAEYFAHLDVSGRRVDLDQRAELCRGSVDFAVPKAYWAQTPAMSPMAAVTSAAAGHASPTAAGASITTSDEADGRPPEPMRYVFAIDVSWQAAQSGVIQEVARSIKVVLYGEEDEDGGNDEGEERRGSLPAGAKVAIVTFDRTVHFYNMRVRQTAKAMRVLNLSASHRPVSIKRKCSSCRISTTCLYRSMRACWSIRSSAGASTVFTRMLKLTEQQNGHRLAARFAARSLRRNTSHRSRTGRCRTSWSRLSSSLWRSGQHLSSFAAHDRTGRAQAPRGQQAVRNRQGAHPLHAARDFLSDRCGGMRRSWLGPQPLPLPESVHRRGESGCARLPALRW